MASEYVSFQLENLFDKKKLSLVSKQIR